MNPVLSPKMVCPCALAILWLVLLSGCWKSGDGKRINDKGKISKNLIKLNNSPRQGEYFFGPQQVQFYKAQEKCKESALRLLSVDTSIEQALIESFLKNSPSLHEYVGLIWTSGAYSSKMNTYEWKYRVGFSSFMDYKHFAPGQTTCEGTNVAMSNEDDNFGLWYLKPRNLSLPFICEA